MIAEIVIIIAIAGSGVLMVRFRKRWLAKINIILTNRITSLSLAGFRVLAFSRTWPEIGESRRERQHLHAMTIVFSREEIGRGGHQEPQEVHALRLLEFPNPERVSVSMGSKRTPNTARVQHPTGGGYVRASFFS